MWAQTWTDFFHRKDDSKSAYQRYLEKFKILENSDGNNVTLHQCRGLTAFYADNIQSHNGNELRLLGCHAGVIISYFQKGDGVFRICFDIIVL